MKWLKEEFSKDNLTTTFWVFIGMGLLLLLCFLYAKFINWLGFYGQTAIVVGFLILFILILLAEIKGHHK